MPKLSSFVTLPGGTVLAPITHRKENKVEEQAISQKNESGNTPEEIS
jgi:hypothetical protein